MTANEGLDEREGPASSAGPVESSLQGTMGYLILMANDVRTTSHRAYTLSIPSESIIHSCKSLWFLCQLFGQIFWGNWKSGSVGWNGTVWVGIQYLDTSGEFKHQSWCWWDGRGNSNPSVDTVPHTVYFATGYICLIIKFCSFCIRSSSNKCSATLAKFSNA